MNLTVNGESFVLEGAEDIPALLAQMGAHADRVAVMVNDTVVAHEAWATALLAEGDRVEVLIFAGGG